MDIGYNFIFMEFIIIQEGLSLNTNKIKILVLFRLLRIPIC